METGYSLKGRKIYQFVYDFIDSNMYVIMDEGAAVIIDPVLSEEADQLLSDHGIYKLWILLTHEHYDHIAGLNHFKEKYECTVIGSTIALEAIRDPKHNLSAYLIGAVSMCSEGADLRQKYRIDEEYSTCGDLGISKEGLLLWNGCRFIIKEIPGHSPGSVCISVDNKYYFTGDSLVDGNDIILRLPGGDKNAYSEITRPYLRSIPNGAIVFPGHGKPGNVEQFHII